MKKELTARQKKFALAYLKTLNSTQAAIDAGYGKGNPVSCAARGYELVRKREIKEFIDAELGKIAEEDKIDIKYVLDRLKTEAERETRGSSHSARVSSLGILAKYLGMLVEKHEHSGEIKINIIKFGDVEEDK